MLTSHIVLLTDGQNDKVNERGTRIRQMLDRITTIPIKTHLLSYDALDISQKGIRGTSANTPLAWITSTYPAFTYRVSMHTGISRAANILEDFGVRCLNSPSLSRITNDKFLTQQILAKRGIPTPRSIKISSNTVCKADFDRALSLIDGSRIVIKPNFGRRSAGVQNLSSLSRDKVFKHANFLFEQGCKEILLQEELSKHASLRILVFGDGKNASQVLPYKARFRTERMRIAVEFEVKTLEICAVLGKFLNKALPCRNYLHYIESIQSICSRSYEATVSYCAQMFQRSSCIISVEVMFKGKSPSHDPMNSGPLILEINSMPLFDTLHKWPFNGCSAPRKSEARAILEMVRKVNRSKSPSDSPDAS